MNSLFSILQYGLAILEIYMCYCFYKLLEPDRFKENANTYIWCWSFVIGMLLAYNRDEGTLLSWTMLILQSVLILYGKERSISNSFSLIILIMATASILIGNIKGAEIKNEIQMIEIRNKMLGERYQEIKDIFHNYACTYHDMKNHLLVIEDFCESGESDRAI